MRDYSKDKSVSMPDLKCVLDEDRIRTLIYRIHDCLEFTTKEAEDLQALALFGFLTARLFVKAT